MDHEQSGKSFTLRLPPELHEPIAAMAERERRSLHGQVLYLLDRALEALEDAEVEAWATDYAARMRAGQLTPDELETVPLDQAMAEIGVERPAGKAA